MIRVLSIFGTRPEAIKMAPLVKMLGERPEFDSKVAVTGQHREMLDSVLDSFGIAPDFDLNIMTSGQTLSSITSKVLVGLGEVLDSFRPDVVLVHGDTSTSFAGALAAFYRGIQIGHVEAGLRTYDIHSPFPEEFNRQAISLISTFDFCPTEQARQNLLSMGKNNDLIYVTGNTAIDAIFTKKKASPEPEVLREVGSRKLVFMTCHRRENLGEPMKAIFKAVNDFATSHPDFCLVYPVHPNPKVVQCACENLTSQNILLIEPVDVTACHKLIEKSFFVLTDSGGLQEEAPAFHKPVLVLRDKTERPEGVSAGTLLLAGNTYQSVSDALYAITSNSDLYKRCATAVNPYGDGHACERICNALAEKLC